jgi:hypothetical protein
MVAALRLRDAATAVESSKSLSVTPLLLALAAVLPLLAPSIWSGFRLAPSDPILSALASSEAPLSWRDPIGDWAVGLALAWFALAYRSRDFRRWEVALVALGGIAALVRVGNAWVDGLVLVVPLGRQLTHARPPRVVSAIMVVACLAIAAVLAIALRPPELPSAAIDALRSANAPGAALTDWRWAPDLQRDLGAGHTVLAAGGLTAESSDFWSDYLRVALGHERSADILRQWHVDLVVLDPRAEAATVTLVRDSSDWYVLLDREDALVAERVQS